MESHHIILIVFCLIALVIIVHMYNESTAVTTVITTSENNEHMVDLSVMEYDSMPLAEQCNFGNECRCNKHMLFTHFEHFNDTDYQPDYAWLSQNNLMPWWNSTRRTKNMSYDLRGDVPIIPGPVGPWNNSPLI